MLDVDYTGNLGWLAYTPAQADPLLHNLKDAAGRVGIGHHVNAYKTEYICFKKRNPLHS